MNNLKKIMIFLFVFLISFLMLGKNSQVSATISKPEYYSPSYCPYILSLVGVVGNDTRLIRVGGSEGKLAYCLNPSRDVPHLYDGESGQLSENDYLYYYTSDEMPGVTYIVYNGGSRLAIPSISEGKTLVSNNKQWLEYAWSVNAKYDLYTGNNVPYEWVRAYFVTQNAIWWYQDLLDDANWGGSGADGFKRLGLYGDTSVIVDYHVRPDNQTTEDALAIARESADLACSSYAATKQIHTVSSLPLQCQTVYNNGSEISQKLHEVIKNKT